jgi:hypothetical protein
MRAARGRVLIAACIGITVALGAVASHWLAGQPYVPAENTLQNLHDLSWQEMITNPGNDLGRGLFGLTVLCLPFSLPLAFRRLSIWIQLPVAALAFWFTYWMASPLPWLGNTITQYGVISPHSITFGERHKLLSTPAVLLLGTAGMTSAAFALCRTVRRFSLNTGKGKFAALTLPFLFTYVAALAFRATLFGLFDRYLIPLLFVAATLAIGASARVSRLSWSAAAVFGLYALATTHDYFAEARAKLSATQEILRAGHARDTILGGFESDAWAEADIRGYVNNDQVEKPPDAYEDADDCNGPPDTQVFWRSDVPDLKASYVVSLSPLTDLQPSEFTPVAYWRWLPPGKDHIYVEKASPPLICQAAKN